jgi:hypothetical protein
MDEWSLPFTEVVSETTETRSPVFTKLVTKNARRLNKLAVHQSGHQTFT